MTPKMIPAGKSSIEFSLPIERLPSFKAPESDKLKGPLVERDSKTDKTNVEIEVAAKTLHSMLNVQNVFGLEIS